MGRVFGMPSPFRTLLRGGAAPVYSPNALFAASEAGDWFDPSDLTRMWQDTAGTTPVTADGQTVALILGQRRGANVELVTNGGFETDISGWSTNAATITWVAGAAQVTHTGTNGSAYQAFATTVGRFYRVTGTHSGDVNRNVTKSDTTTQFGTNFKNLLNLSLGNSNWFVATATTTYIHLGISAGGSGFTATFDNISVKEVALTALTQSDAAKRPAYKTSGGLHWLQFDGTNDALASAATLNLTGTDEVTVCAGVRKNLNGAVMVVAETSASSSSNGGSFLLLGNLSSGSNYTFGSNGTTGRQDAISGATSEPSTAVLSGVGKISTDVSVLRQDGVQAASAAGDQGTGNYGNHTLFVGGRAGTALYFNGNIYFLLIRGVLTSGADLTALEGFAAAKTGFTVPVITGVPTIGVS
jgi:hypothetical protein